MELARERMMFSRKDLHPPLLLLPCSVDDGGDCCAAVLAASSLSSLLPFTPSSASSSMSDKPLIDAVSGRTLPSWLSAASSCWLASISSQSETSFGQKLRVSGCAYCNTSQCLFVRLSFYRPTERAKGGKREKRKEGGGKGRGEVGVNEDGEILYVPSSSASLIIDKKSASRDGKVLRIGVHRASSTGGQSCVPSPGIPITLGLYSVDGGWAANGACRRLASPSRLPWEEEEEEEEEAW